MPAAAASSPVCIVLGEQHLPPSQEFLARFADLKKRILAPQQCDIKFVGEVGRVVEIMPDRTSGGLVFLLQLASLRPSGANVEADAGWAFKDETIRRKYEIITRPEGGFEIKEGAIVKQVNRSDTSATPSP